LICLISRPLFIERSFQGLSVAIETVRIDEELMEIWPNEVCDSGSGEVLEKKSVLDAHGYTKIDYITRVRKSFSGS